MFAMPVPAPWQMPVGNTVGVEGSLILGQGGGKCPRGAVLAIKGYWATKGPLQKLGGRFPNRLLRAGSCKFPEGPVCPV